MIRQALTAAILGAALVSGAPAFAQDVRSMTVGYSDLNLGSKAGAAAFERRVEHAVATVCGEPTTHDLSNFAEVSRCLAQARTSVRPQMEQAYARAGRTGTILLASR